MIGPGDRLPEDLLSGYVDGELTPTERGAVEARLLVSEAWAVALVEITEVRATVRGLPMPEAPLGFWDELLSGPELVVSSRRRTRVAGPLRWFAGAAAVAVVAVAFVVPSGHHTSPPVATLVDSHAARSSLDQDPISQLAPVARPVTLAR